MRKTIHFATLVMLIALVAVLSVNVVAAQDKVTINWWHISTAGRSSSLLAGSRR